MSPPMSLPSRAAPLRHPRWRVLLISFLLAAPLAPVYADAMRCGSRVVRTGDTRAAVAAICGEPADIQTKSILRRPQGFVDGRRVFFGDGLVEIQVETWTYNFGPSKLLRRVRFVDGVLDEIETGGYGYRE